MTDNSVSITREELIRLRIDSESLQRLNEGGVSDWEWCWISLNPDHVADMSIRKEEIRREVMLMDATNECRNTD